MDHTMEYDVFISHSSSTVRTANAIQKALHDANLTCFMSGSIIHAGEDWRTRIAHAILSSKCMVILFTDTSNGSVNVKSEISYALKHKKPIIPLLIDGFEFQDGDDFQIEMYQKLSINSNPTREQKREIVDAVKQWIATIPPNHETSPVPPDPRPKKWVIVFLSILLFILLLTGAYFVFFANRDTGTPISAPPTPAVTVFQPSPTAAPVPTAEPAVVVVTNPPTDTPAAQPEAKDAMMLEVLPPIQTVGNYSNYYNLTNGVNFLLTDDYKVTYREYEYTQTYGMETERVTKPLLHIYLPDPAQAGSWSQYATIDLSSSYMRLIDRQNTAWGASVILLPAFWTEDDTLYQGGEIAVDCTQEEGALFIHFIGIITNAEEEDILRTRGYVKIERDKSGQITATVNQELTPSQSFYGEIPLSDSRKNEAFQYIKVSTMSCTNGLSGAIQQDSSSVVIGRDEYLLPYDNENKFAVPFGIYSDAFTVAGSRAKWDNPAMQTPSYSIQLLDPARAQIAGWYTADPNPNHDNVAIWAASSDGNVLNHWSYKVTAYSPE